jgi:glutathione S-transferase
MTNVILFTNKFSRGITVKWLLEELGCSYEEKFLECGAEMKTPEYLAINPMGKVPAIMHNGNIVTETAAICLYLSEVFSEKQLCPQNEAEKANCYRWMFFAAGPLEESFVINALGINLNNEQKGIKCFIISYF